MFSIISCSNSNIEDKTNEKQLVKVENDDEKIIIHNAGNDTLIYTKSEMEKIEKCIPQLFSNPYPIHPDLIYLLINSCDETTQFFSSEVGIDNFYMIYAYYLKNKNGINKYITERENLISVYRLINSLNSNINYGGTYYGHQNKRIIGYAEFDIYDMIDNESYKNYDISKQRDLFIQSLNQFIVDEVAIDDSLSPEEKKERGKELINITSNLSGLITNSFYLSKAQEFQYRYY